MLTCHFIILLTCNTKGELLYVQLMDENGVNIKATPKQAEEAPGPKPKDMKPEVPESELPQPEVPQPESDSASNTR